MHSLLILPLTIQSIVHSTKPVIAAINGAAVGVGMTLPLCCDLTVAAEDATVRHTCKNVRLYKALRLPCFFDPGDYMSTGWICFWKKRIDNGVSIKASIAICFC